MTSMTRQRWTRFAGLVCLTLLGTACGVAVQEAHKGMTAIQNSKLFHQGQHGELSEQEREWVAVAWKYFENNANVKTGFVNTVDKVPSGSMWQVADYMAALITVRELEVLDPKEFDQRMSTLLHSLNTMQLFFGQLPNKVYNTESGQMVNYANQPEEIGWSAIDIGRLLIWLRIARERYPKFAEYIDKVVLRWNFCEVLDDEGVLYGAAKVHDQLQKYQEGRLGYEEYAALGYQAWGFDTFQASQIEPYHLTTVHGIDIAHDDRDPRSHGGTYAPIVSLPYILSGLEFNWDQVDDEWSPDSIHTDKLMAHLAEQIYLVQAARYANEKIFTARTDHQLSTPPFFVYDSIFAAGYAWNTISDSGEEHAENALVSTRAAFGLWGLWKTPYTAKLLTVVDQLCNPARGWLEGRFEKTGGYEDIITGTTNVIVLEALLYKKIGKLYRLAQENSHYQIVLGDEFTHPGKCFPAERQCVTGGCVYAAASTNSTIAE